ncbi:hypothetical protein GOV08_03340 [Candidatus Woesearchaeota archaeon]|nr:hypothetical protein [Candidatus Woesearchaeota archaeon]
MAINSFIYGFRKYGKFSAKEWKNFLITVVILGFIIGFNDKRATSSIDTYYILFMIYSMLIVAFTLLLKLLVQRAWLYKFGQKPEFNYAINSLLIGIVLIFASEGHLWFLAPGTTITSLLQAERLGKWRYGLKYFEHGWGLTYGIWALLLMAIILKFFQTANSVLLTHAIYVLLAISIYSMLPLPENDGIYIMYGRRWVYVFTLALVVFTTLLIKFASNGWLVLFGAIALAIVSVITFNLKIG